MSAQSTWCRIMARCDLGLCVVLAVSRIDAAGPLGLEVTVPRPAIVQGEPVVVEVRLGNISAEPVTVDPLLAPEAGRLIWYFTSPAGTERRYRPVFLLDGEARPRELAPGESLVARQMLLVDAEAGPLFGEPGEHQIEAMFSDTHSGSAAAVVRSNRAAILVREAVGDDAEARQRFSGRPQAMFAMRLTADWAIAAEYEAIAGDYPQSPYAPWSRYFLARSGGEGGDRRDRSARAIIHLRTIVERYPGFPLALEARYLLAREQWQTGQREAAMENLGQVAEGPEGCDVAEHARSALTAYRGRGEVLIPELP